MADAKKMIPWIRKWEGGFVNDPIDRGGATNQGVTIATFRTFYGQQMSVDDLKAMTEQMWERIFTVGYWKPWQADHIPNQSIAEICVDWGWASGVKTAIRQVQALVGVDVDGYVGPKTRNAICVATERDPRLFFNRLKEARLAFVREIVRRNPSQVRFLRGWENRINDIHFSVQ